MTDHQPGTIYLQSYSVPDFLIEKVYLNFDLRDAVTFVTSVLHIRRNPASQEVSSPLVLDGEDMLLKRVVLDGAELSREVYEVDKKSLTIASVKNSFTLELQVEIEPQHNKSLMGLYRSGDNYCTQCEAEGFRRITYYLDRPDVLSRFIVTIEADKKYYPYLLSNGNLVEEKELADNRHWVKWEDPSLKPCYLFALVAGDFDYLHDQYQTLSGRQVALQLFVEKGFKDQAPYALGALKRAMEWDEQTWGREYDLDIYMIVAVSDFNMGAMENKGLNIFNTKYVLAKPDTATDSDYVGIEGVIGHEYFHNWSGNRVTCRDWFQITLKEGLTVFRDQVFTGDMTSQAVSRLDAVDIVRNRQFREDAGPLAHPIRPESYIEINNFYTLTVYRKGSEVIRMVQTLLTPPVFRDALDLYFEKYDGQAVTTDDFIAVMEQQSKQDLSQFKRWYSQSGTPELDITSDYDSVNKKFTLKVSQSCPSTPGQETKKLFYIPLAIGLLNSKGEVMPMQLEGENQVQTDTKVLIIHDQRHSFVFSEVEQAPIPSLLRGFSAPVKIKYPYSKQALAQLWQCDTDPFCRWDAGQQLMLRFILEMVASLQDKNEPVVPDMLVASFKAILTTGPEDLAFRARLLMLPSDSYIHQHMQLVDVHAVYQVKKYLEKALAEHLSELFLCAYNDSYETSEYVYDASHMGRRSYNQVCLMYLVASHQQSFITLAYQQFDQANNMTDQLNALLALNHHECVEREQALLEFYQRWQSNPLVVNKWLQLQASATVANTFSTVMGLLQHEAFDIYNPNNVYSLLCSFSENNMHFHEIGGTGYQLIADQVLAIQSHNPQVAVRVLQPLTYWRCFGAQQGQLMRQQLQRIAESQNLSTDVYEIVNKSLS